MPAIGRDRDDPWITKGDIISTGNEVLEMSVRQWNNPRFGTWFAEGIADYGSCASGVGMALSQLFAESATTYDLKRSQMVYTCQKTSPNPVSVLINPDVNS